MRNIPEERGRNMDAILWLAAVVVLLVIEIATLGLTTIWFDCLTDPADFYKTDCHAIPEYQSNPYQCGKPDWQGGGGNTDDRKSEEPGAGYRRWYRMDSTDR